MSNTINLVLPFNDKNVELVKTLLGKADLSKTANIEVVDAEEVEGTAPAKTPAKRPSRAKPSAKPKTPVIEEEDEDLDDDLGEADEEEESDDAEITEDDLRELSAKKIGKHKDAIIAQLAKYKVKGWANLPEKHYQAMHDFLTKLK